MLHLWIAFLQLLMAPHSNSSMKFHHFLTSMSLYQLFAFSSPLSLFSQMGLSNSHIWPVQTLSLATSVVSLSLSHLSASLSLISLPLSLSSLCLSLSSLCLSLSSLCLSLCLSLSLISPVCLSSLALLLHSCLHLLSLTSLTLLLPDIHT